MNDFKDKLFQQFSVGDVAAVADTLRAEVRLVEVADASGQFAELVVAGRHRVVLHEGGRTPQHLRRIALVLKLVVEHHFKEVAVKDGQDELDGVLLGVGGEVVDDAVAHHGVAAADGLLELEDVVVLADTYLFLDELLGDAATSGKQRI